MQQMRSGREDYRKTAMADNKTKTFVRTNSAGRRSSGSGRPVSQTKNTNVSQASSRDLLSREEEYKRLNDELEAKTATLVREAETVISEQSELFSRPSLLDNAEEFFEDDDVDDSYQISESITNITPPASRQSTGRASTKISNEARAQTHSRQQNRAKLPASGRRPPSVRTKSKSSKSNVADDVAVPDDTFLTEFKDFSLQNAISNIEDRLDVDDSPPPDDDVMPSAAAEMGAEAQIRFLKAKLRVMQEELDRLAAECNRKDDQNGELSSRLKEVEEDKARFQRTSSSQQLQIDKYKRLAEEARGKADSLDNQLSATKKELDSMKRVNKQQTSSQSTTEVRLNRALEEVEKYKAELSKSKSHVKETKETDKKKVEQLLAENKRLEKQKNELMTGFKKQLKLIDILKRQKMHIEAAKMLSFTEEEFVKALEWGQ